MKKKLNSILLFGILMTITIATNAQLSMIKDIQTTTNKAGSNPASYVAMNGFVYFTATEASVGTELWRTDGTTGNTELVKDIKSGSGSSNPNNLIVYHNNLYFQADDGVSGIELWKTDGTDNGTEMVMDIYPGSAGGWGGGFNSSSPQNFLIFKDSLFFQAKDGNGAELWKSNGTDSGTFLVKNIYTGNAGGFGGGANSSYPQNLIVVNNILFFVAASNNIGYELWKSDGTNAGTMFVKDINPSKATDLTKPATPPLPKLFVGMNNILYFSADNTDNSISDDELWRSDGTSSGTYLVKDINLTGSSSISFLINFNNSLFFSADDGNGGELWTSDGTGTGTVLFKDINTLTGYSPSNPGPFTIFKNNMYFAAQDGFDGYELWVSDGTKTGTKLLNDILLGAQSSSPALLTPVGDTLYFVALNSGFGNELWMTTGTAPSTVMVKDIWSGINSSNPRFLTLLITSLKKNILIFSADNGANGSNENREPWKSDGTPTGTSLIKEIASGTGASSPSQLVRMKTNIYFTATDSLHGNELWKTDGVVNGTGTTWVRDIVTGVGISSTPLHLTNVNDVLFFTVDDGGAGHGNELWKSNGTSASIVKDINSNLASSNPDNFCNMNNNLYFSADDGNYGNELWKSDGTSLGTVMVKNIYPDYYPSNPSGLTNVNGTLFFTASDSAHGIELWKSNGTDPGTVQVKDIIPGTDSTTISGLFNFNGLLLFRANDGINGTELWKSDGTEAGTVMIKDIYTGKGGYGGQTPNSSIPQYFCELNGKVYFQATCYNIGNNIGTELWVTDGTDTGTKILKDIYTGSGYGGGNSSNPKYLTKVGNEIFFTATTKAEGNELWKTNGTASGTILFRNINPGSKSSSPSNLLADGPNLYFVATDGTHGYELWKAENNQCGKTQMTGETFPGNGGSGPTNLCMLNGIVLFAGTDQKHSTELWKYNPVFTYADTARFSFVICNGDSVYVAGKYYKVAKTYRDSLKTATGCDSLILTTINVNPTYTKTTNITKCVGDSVKVGSVFIKATGTYYENLKTFKGCDSNLIYNLTFSPKPPTPVITKTGTLKLTSNAPTGNQWYDDNGPISGATGVDYETAKKGKYYVIVTINGCSSDPSNKMDPLGINEKLVFMNIEIHPNPVSDKLIIEYSGKNINGYFYNINNIQGKTLLQGKLTNAKNEIDVSTLTRGVYFVKIIFDDQIGLVKILKE